VEGVRPCHPEAFEPEPELWSIPPFPSNLNSRTGRARSQLTQGWVVMEAIVVGIDMSKDWQDVHVLPGGRELRGRAGCGGAGCLG
jgi:hypothetical protein